MKHKFPTVYSQHVYENKSFLLMNYCEGTLQDLLNFYKTKGSHMDELLVIHYIIDIMKIVESLHSIGIIHGDIKPDNFLLLMNCNSGNETSEGLRLIDFGKSVDTRLYPNGCVFTGNGQADGFRCIENQTKRPWTFQVDLFGICAIAYCLLHGEYMETWLDKATNRWRPKQPFKRYWQADLWQPLFDTYMNVADCGHIAKLSTFREKFEFYLNSDARRMKNLQQTIARQNVLLFESSSS